MSAYYNELDQDVRTSTIKALSGIEYNVLQVAIDHMIEHQEGLQSDDVPCQYL